MDILINKRLPFPELDSFLKNHSQIKPFSLIYEGVNDWGSVKNEPLIYQYQEFNDDNQGEFCFGLSVHQEKTGLEQLFTEHTAAALSSAFGCAAVCSACRVVLFSPNVDYSLLFEDNKVFLVDDYLFEENGVFKKIVELKYSIPAIL
ncbi:MAG: hypothetical protein WCG12_14140 [Alcaligenaceae bacterium]